LGEPERAAASALADQLKAGFADLRQQATTIESTRQNPFFDSIGQQRSLPPSASMHG
jgi:hypothetical protein